jgi:3-oxoacyl-[acyl-carrier-protein] synthase II
VSSTVALGYALDNLRSGRLDVAFVGGTEAPLDPGIFGAYCAARVMTAEVENPLAVPRPFDVQRDGIVLSEGAAVLICESLSHAVDRGARIYAELAGWCHNADDFSMMMMNPDASQAKTAIRGAMLDAGICGDQVDYIQAHAPGTVADDRTEAVALQDVFGARVETIPVVSVKSMIGHAQGACGAIETVAAALSTYKGLIPRSINCEVLDPSCCLQINRDHVSQRSVRNMLLNTFGFGGKNAAIVLSAFK